MILRSAPSWQPESWKKTLSEAITNPTELLTELKLNPTQDPKTEAAIRQFPLRIPKPFAKLIKPNTPNDPILQQILPIAQESIEVPGYCPDPLKEQQQNPVPGVLHKYKSRALFIVTGGCAIHCRYCFRRHFPYEQQSTKRWQTAINYIEQHPEINEVILSGGDPLLLPDKPLSELLNKLNTIPHITRLRIHSRIPIVLPNRIDTPCLNWLNKLTKPLILVVHCNHPQEISTEAKEALSHLNTSNITLLNQAVLLKNINDNADTLIDLSETLFASNVLPYYLHLLDKTSGTAHFNVSKPKAQKLMQTLLKTLPGYLVPKLVQEIPGTPHKTPINLS